MPFPEQKIAVLRELCLAIRNGGGENFQRKKKIRISRNNIKNLNGVIFLSLNFGFEWMFSNTINHCSSVQSFICKYAYLYLLNQFFSPLLFDRVRRKLALCPVGCERKDLAGHPGETSAVRYCNGHVTFSPCIVYFLVNNIKFKI